MITIDNLFQNKPVLFDGAMGTSIQALNLKDVDPPEMLNLKYSHILEEIHKKYIEAGAQVIETNTFGGSRSRLEISGLADKVNEINSIAVKTAKAAANSDAYIAGSVGPSGFLIEPYGETPRSLVYENFAEQIQLLIDNGADLILIETMISLDEALIALEAAKKTGSRCTGVTLTFEKGLQGFRTSFGESPEEAAAKLYEYGADFIGSNCGHGLEDMKSVAEELRKVSNLPLLIQPNAGLPKVSDGKIEYDETPDMYAELVESLIELGIEFIGGCCGTTYEHIHEGSKVIKSHR